MGNKGAKCEANVGSRFVNDERIPRPCVVFTKSCAVQILEEEAEAATEAGACGREIRLRAVARFLEDKPSRGPSLRIIDARAPEIALEAALHELRFYYGAGDSAPADAWEEDFRKVFRYRLTGDATAQPQWHAEIYKDGAEPMTADLPRVGNRCDALEVLDELHDAAERRLALFDLPKLEALRGAIERGIL